VWLLLAPAEFLSLAAISGAHARPATPEVWLGRGILAFLLLVVLAAGTAIALGRTAWMRHLVRPREAPPGSR
jgi:hypothetical protein